MGPLNTGGGSVPMYPKRLEAAVASGRLTPELARERAMANDANFRSMVEGQGGGMAPVQPQGAPPPAPQMMTGGGMQSGAPGSAVRMAPDVTNAMSDDGRFQTMTGPGAQAPWQGPFNDALRRRMQMQQGGGQMPGQPGMQAQTMPGQIPGGPPQGGMQQGFGGNPQGLQIRSIQDLYGSGGPAPLGFRQGGAGMQGGGFQGY